jgi:hypothetical protein
MLTPTTTTVLDLGATGVGYVDARTILAFAEAVRTTFPPAEDYYLPRCVCVYAVCVTHEIRQPSAVGAAGWCALIGRFTSHQLRRCGDSPRLGSVRPKGLG